MKRRLCKQRIKFLEVNDFVNDLSKSNNLSDEEKDEVFIHIMDD